MKCLLHRVVVRSLGSRACAAGENAAPTPRLSLWYEPPAKKSTDALPLGNGRLASMVFGGVEREHLQLNEDTPRVGRTARRLADD